MQVAFIVCAEDVGTEVALSILPTNFLSLLRKRRATKYKLATFVNTPHDSHVTERKVTENRFSHFFWQFSKFRSAILFRGHLLCVSRTTGRVVYK
uniref:Uncharacterized protein n=1 Tax=Physcomitrium patens TaxID=3218 RepID=A0A2K1KPM2_PHYPA|nr:hypothetical protein PHYPA_006598 [Physcomitrium patens]